MQQATPYSGASLRERTMRVLTVDDHVMFTQGLKSLFSLLAPGVQFEVTHDIAPATELVQTALYDLVLLDWKLQDGLGARDIEQGIRNIERLRDVGYTGQIVMLSGQEGVPIREAIDAGAAGFIPKRFSSETLLAALDVVLAGGIYLPPEVLREAGWRGAAMKPVGDVRDRYGQLTPRQADVCRAMLRGLPNKLIARELGVEVSTVKSHVSVVLQVLGVSSRTELACRASVEGFRVVP